MIFNQTKTLEQFFTSFSKSNNLFDIDKAKSSITVSDIPNPWFVQALLAASAWSAAIFFFSFLVGVLNLKSSGLLIGLGITSILSGALICNFTKNRLFLRHLAVAISIVGLIAFDMGIGNSTQSPAIVGLCMLGVELIVFVIHKDYVRRFLAIVNACSSSLLIFSEARSIFPIQGALIIIVLLILFSWIKQTSLLRFNGEWQRPLRFGLIMGFISILWFSVLGEGPMRYARKNVDDWWLLSMFLAFANIYLIDHVVKQFEEYYTKIMWVVISAFLVLAIITFQTPGISASLFIVLLGFSFGNRAITGAGLVLFGLFMIVYYYNLHISLLVKSVILLGGGSLLLSVSYYLKAQLKKANFND